MAKRALSPESSTSPNPQLIKVEDAGHGDDATPSASPSPAPGLHYRIGKDGKQRKLPACDICKFRRVLCHPVPQPGSCPRCLEKGVKCTTTPVVRRRPQGRTGKRIETAIEKYGAVEPEIKLEETPGPSPSPPPPPSAPSASKKRKLSSTPDDLPHHRSASVASTSYPDPETPPLPPIPEGHMYTVDIPPLPDHQSSLSSSSSSLSPHRPTPHVSLSGLDRDHLLGLAEASGSLAAHLLGLFQHTPDAFFPLPFLARGRLSDEFEAVGRRLDCLPPQIEVLANVIMAITAPISSHSLLVGPGLSAPEYEALSTTPLGSSALPTNLKEFGQRRLSMCNQLRENAKKLMGERNTTTVACEENAASCHLMDVVEARLAMGPTTYNRAYATAFAAHVRELADEDENGLSRLTGTPIIYSSFLMQGNLVAALHKKVGSFSDNDQLLVCGPTPSIEATLEDNLMGVDVRESLRLFYLPLQPFIQGMTRLSRECTELITGAYARRNPLNETTLNAWLKTYESLQALLSVLMKRLEDQLAPETVTAFAYPALLERERMFLLRACRFTLPIAWATLILPVFWELMRRESTGGRGYGGDRKDELKKVEGHLKRVRAMAVKGAQTVAHCLRRDVPSFGYLSHLQYLKLEDFTQILLDADTDSESGDGITQNQQLSDVGLLIAALRRTEFSWVHLSAQIDSFESRYQTLQLEQLLQGFTPGSSNDLFPPPFIVQGLPELSGAFDMPPATTAAHALSGVRGGFEWEDDESGGETAWTKEYQSAWN